MNLLSLYQQSLMPALKSLGLGIAGIAEWE